MWRTFWALLTFLLEYAVSQTVDGTTLNGFCCLSLSWAQSSVNHIAICCLSRLLCEWVLSWQGCLGIPARMRVFILTVSSLFLASSNRCASSSAGFKKGVIQERSPRRMQWRTRWATSSGGISEAKIQLLYLTVCLLFYRQVYHHRDSVTSSPPTKSRVQRDGEFHIAVG